jgi:hypothetical protein
LNEFEFLFGLFGLLLGFSLIEVLKGFVETIKCSSALHSRGDHPVRLGWLTPLLGLFVLLDATSTWVNLWSLRGSIGVGFDSAFATLFIAGIYYFAASLVFPEKPEDWPDLDVWFWRYRRRVLGPIAICTFFLCLFTFRNGVLLKDLIPNAIYFVLLGGAAIPKNRWVAGGSLAIACLIYLALSILTGIDRL